MFSWFKEYSLLRIKGMQAGETEERGTKQQHSMNVTGIVEIHAAKKMYAKSKLSDVATELQLGTSWSEKSVRGVRRPVRLEETEQSLGHTGLHQPQRGQGVSRAHSADWCARVVHSQASGDSFVR